MVYTLKEWTLYEIIVNIRNAGPRKMYFFSKKHPEKGSPCDLPTGYEIGVNKNTEMPYLRYKNKG